jgi:type II restriction/modification system DNA methylase subunit YeeA
LRQSGKIVHGNALRLNWLNICPPSQELEIYVVGNPPFLGARKQAECQKSDLQIVYEGEIEFQDADYVTGWFLCASKYIFGARAEAAFVATSSVSQGEQVAYTWRRIFERRQEICFAYRPFKWTNNAAHNAGVYCVIIGFRAESNGKKLIFDSSHGRTVQNISPYILEGKSDASRACLCLYTEVAFGVPEHASRIALTGSALRRACRMMIRLVGQPVDL